MSAERPLDDAPVRAAARKPRYRITRLIKRGGMAEVYEAVLNGARGFERRVAIKMPLPIYGDLGSEAFTDEARILSQLDHRGIVSVFELGVFHRRPFQALELIAGADLGELCSWSARERAPMKPEVALWLASELAGALHYAHEARSANGAPLHIIHRDVTPENIVVSWNGDVKLIDFGIATSAIRRFATQPGFIKGKPQFMAPEQIAGDALSRRADIFSLGCVLHFMLTGRSPFHGAETRGRLQRAATPVLGENLGRDLAAIVCSAIDHDPARRFATARELGMACRTALSRYSTDARELLSTWLERLRRRPSRTPARSPLVQLFELEEELARRPPAADLTAELTQDHAAVTEIAPITPLAERRRASTINEGHLA